MNSKTKSGLLLASAAAAMFASGVTLAADAAGSDAKVHCSGVNECKGKSDCATASNGCAGQNSCKGKGFKDMSKADCEKAGGTPADSKM